MIYSKFQNWSRQMIKSAELSDTEKGALIGGTLGGVPGTLLGYRNGKIMQQYEKILPELDVILGRGNGLNSAKKISSPLAACLKYKIGLPLLVGGVYGGIGSLSGAGIGKLTSPRTNE